MEAVARTIAETATEILDALLLHLIELRRTGEAPAGPSSRRSASAPGLVTVACGFTPARRRAWDAPLLMRSLDEPSFFTQGDRRSRRSGLGMTGRWRECTAVAWRVPLIGVAAGT